MSDEVHRVRPLMVPRSVFCTCCEHTEHVADQRGHPWVVPELAQPGRLRDEPCRRCGEPCANARCDGLPTNLDGRGYGRIPRARGLLARLRARAR